jgi:hypothetical protein
MSSQFDATQNKKQHDFGTCFSFRGGGDISELFLAHIHQLLKNVILSSESRNDIEDESCKTAVREFL